MNSDAVKTVINHLCFCLCMLLFLWMTFVLVSA